MLWNASGLTGYPIRGTDGLVGTLSDLVYQETDWGVRSLLVNTGDWLSARRVLVPIAALGQPDAESHELSVAMTIRQIEECPDIDAGAPLSAGPTDSEQDSTLHCLSMITGDTILATDGDIGHAADFLVDTEHWQLRYLTIPTSRWWSDEKRLVSVLSVDRIDWVESVIHLDVTCQKVKDSPAYVAADTVDGAFEESFYSYYGIRWARH